MTVRDLIAKLEALNPDATVTISANGGEYVWELDEDAIVEFRNLLEGGTPTVQLGDYS